MFEYDSSAPMNLQVNRSAVCGGVTLRDIRYPSPVREQTLGAFLVEPPGKGPFPACLYVHWLEPHQPTSNRTEFLAEAMLMAKDYGVVSLLVETMWSKLNWYTQGRTLDTDYDDAVRQVIELRRGLDVLLAQPNVDASRVGYVGHDFGAMYGALMASEDRRVSAYAFIAGASDFNQWMLFGVPDDQPGLDAYKSKMACLAPKRFVAQAAPAPVLFQFGTEDFYTPKHDYMALYDAASSPKTLGVYSAGHAMDSAEIREDRVAFLAGALGLRRTPTANPMRSLQPARMAS